MHWLHVVYVCVCALREDFDMTL